MNKYSNFIIFILLIIFSALFLKYYTGLESLVYDDYRHYAYHLEYCKGIDLFREHGIFKTLIFFVEQMYKDPTQFLSVKLLSCLGFFFGKSRFVYESLLIYIYLIPCIYFTVILYKKFINETKSVQKNIVHIFIAFFNVMLWLPTMKGLPDIAGAVPFLILLFLCLKTNFLEKIQPSKMLLLGFLCFICFIIRRTYSTTIFIWFLTFLLYNSSVLISQFKINKWKIFIKKFSTLYLNLLIMTIFFFILFYLILKGLFNYFISGNMILEMSYYNVDNFYLKFHNLHYYINHINLILLLIPFLALLKKKYKFKPLMTMSYIYVILYFIVFIFLQDMVIENYIQLAIIINIILFASYDIIIDLINNKKLKNIYTSFLILFIGFNFYQMFFLPKNEFFPYLFSISPAEAGFPYKTKYEDTFYELYDVLKEKVAENPTSKISSVAGLRLFDPATIYYYAYMKGDFLVANNLIDIHPANTSGIKFFEYDADYMITVNPWADNPWGYKGIQPESWLPVTIPHSMFLTNTGIAKYYKKIKEIKTKDNEFTVILYKKRKTIPKSEMEKIKNIFIEKEPKLEDLVTYQFNKYLNTKH